MSRPEDAITLHLDSSARELLSRVARRAHSSEDQAADMLFHSALWNAALTSEDATALLESIPGAVERVLERRAKYERGEGTFIPLSEFG